MLSELWITASVKPNAPRQSGVFTKASEAGRAPIRLSKKEKENYKVNPIRL